MDDVAIAIPPLVNLEGVIRLEGDGRSLPPKLSLVLAPHESGGMMQSPSLTTEGGFRADGVIPETYAVRVNGLPEGYYFKTIRLAGKEMAPPFIDLNGPGFLEIVLSPSAAVVKGTVRDPKTGKPSSGALVVLIPEEQDRRGQDFFYSSSTTDASGQFRMASVAPGRYKAVAWESVEPDLVFDPDFTAPFESKGGAVDAREGATATVELIVNPA